MNEYQWYHNSIPSEVGSQSKRLDKKNKSARIVPVAVSAAISILSIAVFAIFIMPHIKPSTTIHYSSAPGSSSENLSENTLSGLAQRSAEATVYVSSSGTAGGFFDRRVALGSGSGVIISSDGYIITSNSVVNSGTEINVTLNDGQKLPALVVGNDSKTDIAILKINADNLVSATLGNSQLLKVGDTILAVGNPLAPKIINTVTYGIVSGINDNVILQKGLSMNLIQTDASIGSGNAGGALFNLNGEIIGIVTANVQAEGGISLSIPINDVKPLLTSVMGLSSSSQLEDGTASAGDTPMLGITAVEEKYGVVVETVSENFPAAKAGIKVGDIIMKIDGTPVTTVAQINEIRTAHRRGETLTASVFRDGEALEIQIILE